ISPAAGISARDVTVMTGTEVVTLKNGFNVTAGTPAITTAIPNTGQQGQNVTLAVMGQFTHFLQSTTQVSLGAGITVNSVTVANATSLTAQLSITPTAAMGGRTLTATSGSEVATLNNAFTVTPGMPVLTTVDPNTGK